MTVEETSPSARRQRRTLEQLIADRERELAEAKAKLAAKAANGDEKRIRAVQAAMKAAADKLDVVVESTYDVGVIRDEAKGLAIRLRGWVAP